MRWNGEVLRKLSITQPMCPRRQSKGYIALGSQLCWAPFEPALSGAHYLYPFTRTVGIVVSSVLDRSLILKTLANPLECKYMHFLLMPIFPALCNFESHRDKTPMDTFGHFHSDQPGAELCC